MSPFFFFGGKRFEGGVLGPLEDDVVGFLLDISMDIPEKQSGKTSEKCPASQKENHFLGLRKRRWGVIQVTSSLIRKPECQPNPT